MYAHVTLINTLLTYLITCFLTYLLTYLLTYFHSNFSRGFKTIKAAYHRKIQSTTCALGHI